MLMISKHLGDLDICAPERSAKMQELPLVLVAQWLVADVSVPGADEHPEAGPEARTRPLPGHGSDPPCARPHSW